MKKTLIALAVLAASGASFAQSTVSLTGKFGVAYQQGLGAEAGKKGKANVAVTDGDWNIAAVEDLGGGLKAGANMALRLRGRENVSAVTTQAAANAADQKYGQSAYSEVGRDATVYVSGAFGTLTAGSVEAGNGITGNGWGGANVSLPTDVNNGGVLSANAYGNLLQYTSPDISGLRVSLIRMDSIGTVGVKPTTIALTGNETDQGVNATVISLTYANGPLTAAFDSTSFGGNTSYTGTSSDRTRTRVSAAYDFGAVKVGFGQEDNKGTASTGTYDGKQTTFGLSVPVGALRVGAIYARNTESAVIGAANAVAKATGFSADYSFSKRTVLNMSTAKISRDDLTDGANFNKEGQQYRVRLMHSF